MRGIIHSHLFNDETKTFVILSIAEGDKEERRRIQGEEMIKHQARIKLSKLFQQKKYDDIAVFHDTLLS